MSEIKAVEKLREQAEREPLALTYILNDLADEIEAEISERYMLLPVDADGVPIHMGDTVEGQPLGCSRVKGSVTTYFIHDNDEPDSIYIKVDCGNGTWTIKELRIERCRHVKPRTLENIVADAIQYGHNGITGDRIEGKVAEFCAEIRELLGGDAE